MSSQSQEQNVGVDQGIVPGTYYDTIRHCYCRAYNGTEGIVVVTDEKGKNPTHWSIESFQEKFNEVPAFDRSYGTSVSERHMLDWGLTG